MAPWASSWPVAAAAVTPVAIAVGAYVGLLLARDIDTGIVIVVVLSLAPLLALNLALGIAAWTTLVFIEGIPQLNAAENAVAALIAIGWVAMVSRRGTTRAALRSNAVPIVFAVAFAAWSIGSIAWAQ